MSRTICLRVHGDLGTGFLVPVSGELVIITAKHIVEGLAEKQSAQIEFFNGNNFERLLAIPYFCEGDIDIAILQTGQKHATPETGLELGCGNLLVGQDTFFLGFPYFQGNIRYQSESINSGLPFPLVKKAACSGFYKDYFYLDGHNNPGFSGGPVVFNDVEHHKQKICAVISSYVTHAGELARVGVVETENADGFVYGENSGIIEAYKIEHAINLITNVFGCGPTANVSGKYPPYP